ncbi:hypothetical protein VC83_05713 [Pseudogymnoascus destructans]|uniref:Uncharacterized protein n=2 Tax=Pseudogymnoascus destructans TaxID=655981 RepID=L8FZR2_PSED2|nr:uncharacterized protein VC83_05713 [Pseudogymnoascus destructans]ELR06357.1 hypothetical protein GMDG_07947 [Pseudogymnoascus destructans 20631-21]OAF57592.1 hypothetical protein VC83_05713 [Pseudogymnoascus destructans]
MEWKGCAKQQTGLDPLCFSHSHLLASTYRRAIPRSNDPPSTPAAKPANSTPNLLRLLLHPRRRGNRLASLLRPACLPSAARPGKAHHARAASPAIGVSRSSSPAEAQWTWDTE